ncbi:protein phosphatase 2C domain-containing protein [Agromyces sp. H3Y2-19a]|uniref:PP2C family protein-serine/threonine phosphatase n=1 Tax=Agromyces TaxID=33877 RepID=UPI001E642450|nr:MULTISPECIES: protein phosphatase 2C domain-containing protein [Agromyces]MCD5345241.1 protein phosphatase 2C domain-containing protein [Agromyces sp. S2-1-8]MDF0513600.1 protein phosphatase 2C domain-containing protein [Agromyces chromiiresistens]
MILSAAAATDVGLVRRANEDAALAEWPVYVVADGMGGYEAGDRASAAVVAAFREHVVGQQLATVTDVRSALATASDAVAAVAATTARGAGSTVAGIALVDDDGEPAWLVFNVGDSRVYRHHGTVLEQLTVDHSLGQELVDSGAMQPEDLATFERRNVITRAIGAPDSTADSWLLPVVNGERLLICSDGLTGEVSDEGIRATLTMSGRPESAAAALVQRARQAGGRDNITVVVVDVVSGGIDEQGDATTGLPRPTPPEGPEVDDETTIPVRGRS